MHGFNYELCPWGKHPVENIQERALKLLDQYRKKLTLYRTNTLLVPLGDDFCYISIDEAEAQFQNYRMLFDYVNSNPSLNAGAQFGTLDEYFRTLRGKSDRINYYLPVEVGSDQVGDFPSLSGDFFTYADRQQDYWSGYYISRPFFKAVDRVLEQRLRAVEIMMASWRTYCQRAQREKLPTGFAYKMTTAMGNLVLFQHQDGVTGTAKYHVIWDYGTRMHNCLQGLQIFMSKAIEVLLGIRHDKSDRNPSQFESEQVRSKYDVQPEFKAINAREGTSQYVEFSNPLEQSREEIAMPIVNMPDVTILDSNWTCVRSQASSE
jgi:alpha-mannosidase II